MRKPAYSLFKIIALPFLYIIFLAISAGLPALIEMAIMKGKQGTVK